ncbi:hypothetical protein COI_0673 [Mannheimia haemolytica serotype A2 str. OVINE]|uniref:hypothetical protein n=1 Tax=Mannheimia haemolytica TaxID=75985 RepID=UPI0001BCF685|nr:hypothetical protein [Mannheimia haemolytica]EEY10686.1 hypothetical protein COI_0673 [Mannheimia haemolytica serotype A2 str. OVINE]MDW0618574.1 hypothetical protein [Mannheimia haemolytica]HDL1235459.1 hypothetical protein [Mannheimia haemolytica]HDL1240337.1 hypothetical protein [Mannheimia haemolytica]HDZ6747586.1 hypothetical protein [Mannheimia haemolytica]
MIGYEKSKQSLDKTIDSLTAQLSQVHTMQRTLAKEHIKNALKCVELHELIELANDIYAEQFAQGEIDTYHTTQQQEKINETLRN